MNLPKYCILFVCIHNSARSQMAEAFLKELGGDKFAAESAGIEPGRLNQNVVQVMAEMGIDISNKQTKSVSDLLLQRKHYDAVITVCDEANAEKCPAFPGNVKRIAWSFPDPSAFDGSKDSVLEQTRQVRDNIQRKVAAFLEQAAAIDFWN